MEYTIKPVAFVHNERVDLSDDNWSPIVSEIRLAPSTPAESLDGLEEFSHLEVFFIFHKATDKPPVLGAEHPRENKAWPRVGIFAQRKKNRPNHLGATVVELVRREGASLFVRRLDAIDGTPVIDIKPVMKEFLPHGPVRQPAWAGELMQNYW